LLLQIRPDENKHLRHFPLLLLCHAVAPQHAATPCGLLCTFGCGGVALDEVWLRVTHTVWLLTGGLSLGSTARPSSFRSLHLCNLTQVTPRMGLVIITQAEWTLPAQLMCSINVCLSLKLFRYFFCFDARIEPEASHLLNMCSATKPCP
jgi:hypothetical protein